MAQANLALRFLLELAGVIAVGYWGSVSGSRGARTHTNGAVVVAATLDRAFARWWFTVECDRARRWAAAFSEPRGPRSRGGSDQRAVMPPRVRAAGPSFYSAVWAMPPGSRIHQQ